MSETDLPFHNGQFAKLYNYELAIESDAVICTVPLWRHSDRILIRPADGCEDSSSGKS